DKENSDRQKQMEDMLGNGQIDYDKENSDRQKQMEDMLGNGQIDYDKETIIGEIGQPFKIKIAGSGTAFSRDGKYHSKRFIRDKEMIKNWLSSKKLKNKDMSSITTDEKDRFADILAYLHINQSSVTFIEMMKEFNGSEDVLNNDLTRLKDLNLIDINSHNVSIKDHVLRSFISLNVNKSILNKR
ncbi:hypothetical protein, partial [Shewanella sp.]